jgi:broad specificity phosphatase PhoE
MSRLLLARHGAVDTAWDGRIYGRLDVPLSACGRVEARSLAERLAQEPIACGESLVDLSARVLPRLRVLAFEFSGAQITIVTHVWVIRTLVCAALDLSLTRALAIHLPTGSLTVIDWPAAEEPSREQPSALPVLAGLCVERSPARGATWQRGP